MTLLFAIFFFIGIGKVSPEGGEPTSSDGTAPGEKEPTDEEAAATTHDGKRNTAAETDSMPARAPDTSTIE